MQKVLTDAQIARVRELISVCELGARFCETVECECCGNNDPMHDVEACKQAGYIGFDLWRSELMDRGLWHGLAAVSDAEYFELLAPEEVEEEYAPDFDDDDFFSRSDRLAVPAMGLY